MNLVNANRAWPIQPGNPDEGLRAYSSGGKRVVVQQDPAMDHRSCVHLLNSDDMAAVVLDEDDVALQKLQAEAAALRDCILQNRKSAEIIFYVRGNTDIHREVETGIEALAGQSGLASHLLAEDIVYSRGLLSGLYNKPGPDFKVIIKFKTAALDQPDPGYPHLDRGVNGKPVIIDTKNPIADFKALFARAVLPENPEHRVYVLFRPIISSGGPRHWVDETREIKPTPDTARLIFNSHIFPHAASGTRKGVGRVTTRLIPVNLMPA